MQDGTAAKLMRVASDHEGERETRAGWAGIRLISMSAQLSQRASRHSMHSVKLTRVDVICVYWSDIQKHCTKYGRYASDLVWATLKMGSAWACRPFSKDHSGVRKIMGATICM